MLVLVTPPQLNGFWSGQLLLVQRVAELFVTVLMLPPEGWLCVPGNPDRVKTALLQFPELLVSVMVILKFGLQQGAVAPQ
jgi:hypothetical protein